MRWRLGVAVSGGGDSVALLRLLAELCGPEAAPELIVYTVDHQLRPEAAAEAAWVGRLSHQLGLRHRSLLWRWEGQGNLSDAARQGRYAALAAACAADGVQHCALGHTRDDNIETLVLGLLRGAGLDGLAGMRSSFRQAGVVFHRPLLEISRAALRDALLRCGQDWHEDPTNQDLTHDRARVRHLLAALDLPEARLAQSLRALAATRRDLGAELLARLAGAVHSDGPCLTIAADVWEALTPEFRRRTLAAALRAVSGAAYAPRAAQLMRLVGQDWIAEPGPVTLAGCRIWRQRGALWLCREAAAAAPPVPANQIWEGWRVVKTDPGAEAAEPEDRPVRRPEPGLPPQTDGPGAGSPDTTGSEARCLAAADALVSGSRLVLGALGAAGHAQITGSWRDLRIPYAALLASPALWDGPRLIAAAFAQPKYADPGSRYQFIAPDLTASFRAAVMAH